ncbi:Pycsar system effector family protein [Spirosoma arcticum]
MTTTLLTQIETYVVRFFDEHPQPALVYHTLTHTREVVEASGQLARHYQLSEADFLTVMAAAWFHDVGYLTGSPQQHEETGISLATAFLQQAAVSSAIIGAVQGCIRATKMPQSPTNPLEEILCDADLFHLGQDTYSDKQKLMRKEQEQLTGTEISGRDWRQQNIALFQTHRYFTNYAQVLLMKGKADNLRRMLDKQAEKGAKREPTPDYPITQNPALTADPPAEKEAKKKDKENRPDRGIETMFRTTSTNHVQLSAIADTKANIMISVNAIMVSVVVSILPRRIEENPSLLIPTVLFLTTSLLTIIFAILATRPNVTQGSLSRVDIEQKKGNLLFFGNFHQMSVTDYEWGIGELLRDSQYLYGTMTRDIYYLGRVLGKKYKLLRGAYNIFMVGFVVSILAFLIVFLFFSKH